MEDPGQRTQDGGPRTEDPGQRTQDRGPRTEDRESRSKDRTEDWEMTTGDQGQWMTSWMTNFQKLNYTGRYIKVYEILSIVEMAWCTFPWRFFSGYSGFPQSWKTSISKLPVEEMAWCTLPWGFFSGYSDFPHSWKTNISKFQFNKICDTLPWANWDEVNNGMQCNTNLLLSVYFLVTCAHVLS